MLAQKIYLAPAQFEAMFVGNAHTQADLDATVAAAKKTLAAMANA